MSKDYRSRDEIVVEMLKLVTMEGMPASRIQSKAGLNYYQAKSYLEFLQRKGLIEKHYVPRIDTHIYLISEKGFKFLDLMRLSHSYLDDEVPTIMVAPLSRAS